MQSRRSATAVTGTGLSRRPTPPRSPHHRVGADPAPVPAAAMPGGWRGLAHFTLHGSPGMHRSGYEPEARAEWARRIRQLAEVGTPVWAIFDNTTSGRATPDALAFAEEVEG